MNNALMHIGMITATVKQYLATDQWVDMTEGRYSCPYFIDDNDEEFSGVYNWIQYLKREDFEKIYMVSEQIKDGFNDEDNPNDMIGRGIVVVHKYKISLWGRYSSFDEETDEFFTIFKEFPILEQDTASLIEIENDKADLIYCKNTFIANDHKNNIPELINALKDIYKFAKSFKEEYVNSFAPLFKTSYKWLKDEIIKDDDLNISLPPIYGDDANLVFKAVCKAFVFGGKGSWNDAPKNVAEYYKRLNRYNKLTNNLHFNLTNAFCYCINKMDEGSIYIRDTYRINKHMEFEKK